ncbi:MAG: hypothetical protein IJR14_05485, partial [Synergistaceae bacterium]|nr:hypothetical protein [Synergistaceae bacterium]
HHRLSAFEKIRIEAPHHELTNAGHITYIEMDGGPSRNIEGTSRRFGRGARGVRRVWPSLRGDRDTIGAREHARSAAEAREGWGASDGGHQILHRATEGHELRLSLSRRRGDRDRLVRGDPPRERGGAVGWRGPHGGLLPRRGRAALLGQTETRRAKDLEGRAWGRPRRRRDLDGR